MAESYHRRQDIGYKQQSNPRLIYATKYLEDADPDVLQDLINVYLLALPEAAAAWQPHLVSTAFNTYSAPGPPPGVVHYCWITIAATGTITAAPTI